MPLIKNERAISCSVYVCVVFQQRSFFNRFFCLLSLSLSVFLYVLSHSYSVVIITSPRMVCIFDTGAGNTELKDKKERGGRRMLRCCSTMNWNLLMIESICWLKLKFLQWLINKMNRIVKEPIFFLTTLLVIV
jgi:hypothetical protein